MSALRIVVALCASMVGMLLAVPFLIAWMPFWLVAALTRAVARHLEPPLVTWPALVESEPTIGWRPKPHLAHHLEADEVFLVTTGPDGWRGQARLAEADVVVFGDSYAFGHGVDDRAFFAHLTPTLRIKAIGSHGYNMVQELLWMRRLACELSNKLVVWFVFLGNDLIDNLEPSIGWRRAPFVRETGVDGDWEIVTQHVTSARWPYLPARYRDINYERLTRCFCDTLVAKRAISACRYLIACGQAECGKVGARLAVMTIPDPKLLTPTGIRVAFGGDVSDPTFDADMPDRVIGAACGALGIPFVAGKSFLSIEHYLTSDDHWNAEGHRRVANMLIELYERERLATARYVARENGGDQ